MNRRGFTLTELMVVLSVLALLVAVLLPTVTSVFAMARSTLCRNNLHQIATALATDRGQRLAAGLVAGWQFPVADAWPGVPYNVCPSPDIYVCPEYALKKAI